MTVMALFRGSYIALLLLLAISMSGVNGKPLCFAGTYTANLSYTPISQRIHRELIYQIDSDADNPIYWW